MNGKSLKVIIYSAILLIIVLAAILLFTTHTKEYKQPISTNETIAMQQALLPRTYLPDSSSFLSSIFVGNSTICPGAKLVNKLFYLPGITSVANYSLFNKSIPIAVYDDIYLFNYSPSLISLPTTCTQLGFYKNFVSNYSSYNISLNGTKVTLELMDNFSAAGLNATSTYYVGPMPHLSWYRAVFTYNHYFVVVGMWGFYKHMNMSKFLQYVNYTYSHLR